MRPSAAKSADAQSGHSTSPVRVTRVVHESRLSKVSGAIEPPDPPATPSLTTIPSVCTGILAAQRPLWPPIATVRPTGWRRSVAIR